jgi:hypothetical protein
MERVYELEIKGAERRFVAESLWRLQERDPGRLHYRLILGLSGLYKGHL